MENVNLLLKKYPFVDQVLLFSNTVKVCSAYAITHLKSGKVYVGSTGDTYYRHASHMGHLRRGTHPNRHLQNAYNQNENIKFLFIFTDDREQAYDWEQQLIDEYKPQKLLFNQAFDARFSGKKFKHSPETIEKMRKSSTGRRLSEEAKKRIGAASKGRSVGLKRSPETLQRMREASKRRLPISEETRQRMSEAQKGKTKKHSPEAIANMKIAAQFKTKKVAVGDTYYSSITEAATSFNVDRSVVRNRIASKTKRFCDWKYIT